MIDFNPGNVCLTANYMVQKLFGNFQAENYIGFEGELPENVYLSTEADAEKIIIKLVNANAEDISVGFDLAGADCTAVKVCRLHHEDLAARNELPFEGEAAYHVQIEEKEVDLNSYVCPANTLDVIVVSR